MSEMSQNQISIVDESNDDDDCIHHQSIISNQFQICEEILQKTNHDDDDQRSSSLIDPSLIYFSTNNNHHRSAMSFAAADTTNEYWTKCLNQCDDINQPYYHHHRFKMRSSFSSNFLYYYLASIIFIIMTTTSTRLKVEAQITHHQYFKITPQTEVNVIEGSTVVLQCVVGNQRGPVQWAKDGFVLGYDRNIPGFPRYSMVGDASLGIHNLRIMDARNEDNGEFQCQVGPGGKNYAPIRATSKVTVLIPPTSIEIVTPLKGKSLTKNSSNVELREGGSVTIECLVTGGKPPAQIKWFRKNVELRPEMGTNPETTTVTTTLVDSNSIQEIESVVYTSKSKITVSGNAEDNGVPYKCEAVHPALTNSRPMRRTISLSVLYPPGEPEITGYTEGQNLKVGDTLKLDCRARGGNPLAQLVWFRNDEQIDFSYTTVAEKYSVNVMQFNVEARDNNAVYRCVSSSPIMERSISKEIKLQVYFGPSKLSITSVKDVKAGDVVSVSCRTEPSNPAAQISWVVDGRPIIHNSTVESAKGGGFITTANITITITNQDRNMKMLSCYAVNDKISETIVESSVLNVLYPPESIHIFGYDEQKALQYETVQRLTCTCNGGNPICTPKWFKADKELNEGTQISVNGNTVTNELVFRVDPSDNGAMYKCMGENSASLTPIKAITTLTVHFPPNKVSIKLTPKQPIAGTQLEILCETGSSNPQSMITWWRDGFMLTGHQDGIHDGLFGGKITRNILRLNVSSQDDGTVITCQAKNQVLQQSVHDATTLNIQYPPEFLNPPLTQFDVIEGQSESFNQTARGNPSAITYKWKREDDSEISDNTGHRIVSDGPILNMTNAQKSDSGIYKIYATNDLATSESSIRVNIQYPAIIKKTTEMVLVDEYHNAHLECFIDANPINEHVIQWIRRKNDSDYGSSSINVHHHHNVPLLTSSSSSSSFDDIASSSTNRMHSEVELLSEESQPFADGAKLKSSLLIINATLRDSGSIFECLANNGIGKEVKSSIILLVLHKPIIDRSPSISKSASESGSSAKLICRAQGTPNVTFTWKREGSVLESYDSSSDSSSSSSNYRSSSKSSSKSSVEKPATKYVIEETKKLDLISYQSVLIINDVTSNDYGPYECIARNDLGFDAMAIALNRTSRPDSPRSLRVVNVTSGSVMLRWMPGFDGGLPQTFRIRYRPLDSSSTGGQNMDDITTTGYMYRDVYPPNATTIIVGGLRDNTEYIFSVMATNEKGDSDYSADIVKASTLKESGITETEKIISKVLAETGFDIPRLFVIICVVCFALLLFNFVVVFYLRARKRRKRYEEESDGYSGGTDSKTTTSSKTTIELYDSNGTNGTIKPSTISNLNHHHHHHHHLNNNHIGHSHMNGVKNGNGIITETSLSGGGSPAPGEDELISQKSDDRFSGQTEYEMEISANSIMALDDPNFGANLLQPHPHHLHLSGAGIHITGNGPLGGGGSDIAPAAFYNAIAAEEDYLNALQQHHQAVQAAMAVNTHHHANNNGTATLITANGPIGTIQTSQGPMQIQLNSSDLTAGYGTIGGGHPHHIDHTMANTATTTYHLVGPDGTLISSSNSPPSSTTVISPSNGPIGAGGGGGLIPPLPPLRSIMPQGPSSTSSVSTLQQQQQQPPPLPSSSSIAATATSGGSMTTFLPAITEEPPITPIGHLV
nr:nephrin-like isoform X2 [Dermatophagoides farinae]